MKISILTLFPSFIESLKDFSVVGRAIQTGIIDLKIVNIRDFAINDYGQVDDYSYGGGPGMLMMPQPIYDSIESVRSSDSKVIYMSPQGKTLNQNKVIDLSQEKDLILLNGHYEGIDQRIIENYVDEEISIGDYVLTGGELPSMVLVDAISRMLEGVLSTKESYINESHYNNLLEYSQYTRPRVFNGYEVPEVLLSGNHKKIEEFRINSSIENTLKKRPDLLKNKSSFNKDKDNKSRGGK